MRCAFPPYVDAALMRACLTYPIGNRIVTGTASYDTPTPSARHTTGNASLSIG
jgi:hypothetical protein